MNFKLTHDEQIVQQDWHDCTAPAFENLKAQVGERKETQSEISRILPIFLGIGEDQGGVVNGRQKTEAEEFANFHVKNRENLTAKFRFCVSVIQRARPKKIFENIRFHCEL